MDDRPGVAHPLVEGIGIDQHLGVERIVIQDRGLRPAQHPATMLSVGDGVKHGTGVEVMRTQVAVVGAGPAGLVLAHLLGRCGVDSVVLETRSRHYVEHRVRAGVLEHPTVQLLCDSGVGERLRREGLDHRGISLRFDRADHRIDFVALTGKGITVYGQQEVVKDLVAARLAAGEPILFGVDGVRLSGIDTDEPEVAFTDGDGVERVLRAPVVAGCDGFHGVCRPSVPAGALRTFERDYPYAWLGILAKAAPAHQEVVYAHGDRGFALSRRGRTSGSGRSSMRGWPSRAASPSTRGRSSNGGSPPCAAS